MMHADARRIGVVLLDYDHYSADRGDFEPSDAQGVGLLQPGFFESPASWPLPTSYIVARGATASATVAGEAVARQAFAACARELRERCSVVVADCGFMWAARRDADIELPSGVVTSGLELIPHAAQLVSGPVGVLTYSKPDLERLLADYPLAERLRLGELQRLPGWDIFINPDPTDGLDMGRVGDALVEYLRGQLTDGDLVDVEALVLECTVLPQLRPRLREVTSLPILDAMTYTCGLSD